MASGVIRCSINTSCFLRLTFHSNKISAPTFTTSFVLLGRKHWNPKYRKERGEKILKVNLPDFDQERQDQKISIEEMRVKLKEKGIAPSREWNEKPMFVGASGGIFEAYVPPEGDGKISPVSLSSNVATEMYDRFGKKSKSYMALRKIRKIDYDFDVPTVAEKAKDIYIEAQKALVEKNDDKLHELVTEKAYPEMMENVKNKTLVWNFIQCLEPPHIVQVRAQELMSKSNMFAQVTVRLHTQQTLAVYDRFGRLMHGSESTVKDVLEYVVFEKHLANPTSSWRIHGKIIPDWLPPREAIKKTFTRPDIDKEFPEPEEETPTEVTKEQSNETAVATA